MNDELLKLVIAQQVVLYKEIEALQKALNIHGRTESSPNLCLLELQKKAFKILHQIDFEKVGQ